MTDRVKRLRQQSLTTQPSLSIERAVLETEAYRQYEGTVSIPELRALSLRYLCQHKSLWLGAGELIVGEKGHAPQAAPTFPEICCHTLEDMSVMDARELISFKVSEADMAAQRDVIIPYWQGKSMREKILAAQTDAWRDCYAAGLFTEFMEQRGPGHTVGSFKLYEKGFLDYKADIAAAINALDYQTDLDATRKLEQLRAMDIACDAVMILGARYAALAREQAAAESDPTRKAELLQIAENCDVVPAHAPRTFWQAIQMYWFVHLCVTTELNPWDAYSPGRLDQHLIPFYRADVQNNRLSDPEAL
jgi:formate C-acetyltransferase